MSELIEGLEPPLGRKVRITPELMQAMVESAAGRGNKIDWGEPDQDGFYTPTVTLIVETVAIP